MARAGITDDKSFETYNDFIHETAEKYKEHTGFTDVQFCDYLFDFYKDRGKLSHAIERR